VQRSGNFGRDLSILDKMGAGTSPTEPKFFLCGKPRDVSATLQRPIFTKFGHETFFIVPSRNPERHFRKFSLGDSLLFSSGQTAVKLSGAEAADRAQCAAPN